MPLSLTPDTIWRNRKIHLPELLVRALEAELRERGVFEEARGPDLKEKVEGGESEEASLAHFVHRFKTSAARVQFVTLDPSGTFEPLATELRGTLLDGSIALLDLACGSGGGLLGLLATVAELRGCQFTPTLPLDIGLLAADCSTHALSIHEAMLNRLYPGFATAGIRLRWNHSRWDVAQPLSTVALVDHWFRLYPGAEEYLVLISASAAS